MKRFVLLCCIAYFGISFVQAQSIKLPQECKKILNKNFRGWEIAKVPEEVSKFFRDKRFSFQPNLIKGDWNGDGKTDYAVLIKQGSLYNYLGEPYAERRFMVAFVKTKKGFKYFRFDGSEYIALIKKGAQDYDYETDKKFRYRRDAIFDGFWEKAGVSYVWEKGKFRVIATSD